MVVSASISFASAKLNNRKTNITNTNTNSTVETDSEENWGGGHDDDKGGCKARLGAVQIEGTFVANTCSFNPNWALSCHFGQSAFYMNPDPGTSKILCIKCSGKNNG